MKHLLFVFHENYRINSYSSEDSCCLRVQPEPDNRRKPPAYFPVELKKTELFNRNRPGNSRLNREKPEPEKTEFFNRNRLGIFRFNRKKQPGFSGSPVPVEPQNRVPIPGRQVQVEVKFSSK